MTGTTQIVEAIDRLYRLIDTSYNGTQYTAEPPDPVTGDQVVTPAIPAAPPASTDAQNAMRAHLGRLWQLAENSTSGATFGAGAGITGSTALNDNVPTRETIRAAQGIINAGWFGIGGQPATMADIINALRVGSQSQAGIIDNALEEILNAGGNTSSIFNAVRGLFDSTVNTIGEGATIGTLLASSMASAAMAGAQAAQLDRLINELSLLNRALVGTDAAVLPANPPNTVGHGALYYQTDPEDTAPGIYGLTAFIARVIGEGTAGYQAQYNLHRIRQLLEEQGVLGVDQGGNYVGLAEWAMAQTAAAQQISAYINTGTPPGTALALLDDIRSAIRQLAGLEAAGTVVTGSALRMLLDELECICRAVSTLNDPPEDEDPEPGLNEPPAGQCEALAHIPWRRAVNWDLVGTDNVMGEPHNIYRPVFDLSGTPLSNSVHTESGLRAMHPTTEDDTVRVCLSWDFTGYDVPSAWCRDIGTSFSGIAQSDTGFCTTGSFPAGGRSDDISYYASASTRQYFVWNFAFPQGSEPSLNIFMRAESILE